MNAVSRLTAKELNLAARTVFAEAATEGLNGQMAVAQTMYDQLHHNIIGADVQALENHSKRLLKMPIPHQPIRISGEAAA